MPPKVQASNAKHYKGEGTITEVEVFEGRGHLICSEPNWQEVADYTLAWAEQHTEARPWPELA